MASIVVGMAETTNVILTESPNYPISACVSDTGGAAGLFLGLHVLGEFGVVRDILNTINTIFKVSCLELIV